MNHAARPRWLLGTLMLWWAGALMAPVQAQSSKTAKLHVYGNDKTQLFSDEGIRKARAIVEKEAFVALEVTFDLFNTPPRGEVPSGEKERAKFFLELARELATADKARGIYVLVNRSPGYIQVLVDKATRDRGFTSDNEKHLRDLLLKGFREAATVEKDDKQKAMQVRDEALIRAVEYIVRDLKGTSPPASTKTRQEANHGVAGGNGDRFSETGSSLAGWICIGLLVLLAVWLIVGLIRAFSGMGGGAGSPGGGGGGFLSSLLGGLFGAMAGMWLYNHLFGGASSWFSGTSDTAGSSSTPESGRAAGEGDFSGDAGAGGSFDDTGGGGAGDDWSGGAGGDWGGGDWDGGGDLGGGGGDF
ncbi:MAG: hypothetical protein NZ703_01180 [Gemmataceae bacterium]|nr:hypothetical protein [Gemmataceae bacterium]